MQDHFIRILFKAVVLENGTRFPVVSDMFHFLTTSEPNLRYNHSLT
jgi:hypothetical protein